MIGDLHRDTCLLPKVALPKVQTARMKADASASQLQPDGCQNRQHLSCHCHLHKESTVSQAHGFTESRAGLSTGRHSKNNVAGVDDMVSAQLELKLCLLFATQNTLLNNALFTRLRSAPVKIMCMQAQPLCKDSRYYGIYNVVSGYRSGLLDMI